MIFNTLDTNNFNMVPTIYFLFIFFLFQIPRNNHPQINHLSSFVNLFNILRTYL